MYDVAIIGAGPVGSRVAFKLAETGHRVVVIDQKSSLGEPVCCTGIIGQECATRFAIDESVIIRHANSAKIFSPSGKVLNLKRPEPQACIVDRPAFNVALARLAQNQGVEYLLDSMVKNIDVQKDRVKIGFVHSTGKLDSIEARAAVIAAGSASRLTERLGFGKVGDFAMGAQAVVETTNLGEVEVYLGRKIAPAFFAWLVPTSPDRALVGLMTRRKTGFYLNNLMSSLAAQGRIVSAEVDISYSQVPLKPVAKTFKNRVIVVGSAAGQVKPITGGGIYYGLICADIAADNLHRALESDNLTTKNLAGYEIEWRKRLWKEIRQGYWAREFFELLSDKRIESLFDIIKSSGIVDELLKSDEVAFDWHGKSVLKLLTHGALTAKFGSTKFPLPSSEDKGLQEEDE